MNVTENSPTSTATNTSQYSIYIVLGISILLLNGSIFLSVITSKHNRSQTSLMILSAVSLSEFLSGIAYFGSGIRRLWLTYMGPFGLKTPKECITEASSIFFSLSNHLIPWLLFILALDRFLAVWSIEKYLKLTAKRKMLIATICFPFVSVFITLACQWLVAFSRHQIPSLSYLCIGSAVGPTFSAFSQIIQLIGIVGSSTLYLGILVMLCLKPKSQFRSIQESQASRQRQITKLILLIFGFTLVFYLLPSAIILSANLLKVTMGLYNLMLPFMSWLTGFHSIINAIVQILKVPDIRNPILQRLKKSRIGNISVNNP